MKSKVKIKRKPKKAIKQLALIDKYYTQTTGVLAGLPKNSKQHKDDEGGFTSVIEIGLVHEFGAPSINVPQRSYLRSTIIENKRKYKAFLAKLSLKILKGELTPEKALAFLGEMLSGDIKEKITDIKDPELKIRIGGNPLVDTGQLIQSITYIIRE